MPCLYRFRIANVVGAYFIAVIAVNGAESGRCSNFALGSVASLPCRCHCVLTCCMWRERCQVLIEKGVKEDRILFLNIISCPEGIKALTERYPAVKIVTAEVDSHLNEKKWVVA